MNQENGIYADYSDDVAGVYQNQLEFNVRASIENNNYIPSLSDIPEEIKGPDPNQVRPTYTP